MKERVIYLKAAGNLQFLYWMDVVWLRRWAVKKNLIQFQIPPAPPRPDFDASREKLQKLGEGEGSMTKEEFTKMKQELEAYVDLIATFFFFKSLNF